MAVPTQLSLYAGACLAMGTRRVLSLSESSEPRRELDAVWNTGAVRTCLEEGLWNHALRTVQVDYDTGYTAPFGFSYRFDKPDDYVRTAELCQDEWFREPLLQIQDEANYWFCELQTIYVRYVSDGASYGLNFALWPETFTRYVEHYLALRTIKQITGATADYELLKADTRRLKIDALSKDAMKEPAKFPPESAWNRARRGNSMTRRHQHPYR